MLNSINHIHIFYRAEKEIRYRKIFIPKSSNRVEGLDEITEGGFPQGRPTLICGDAGCGKTLLSMQFLINGIREFDETGVFMSFEEPSKDLTLNVKFLGFDLEQLKADKKLVVDCVRVERSEIEEAGEYDLDGLFVRFRLCN